VYDLFEIHDSSSLSDQIRTDEREERLGGVRGTRPRDKTLDISFC
jgi:hypothetical protein